MVHFDKNLSSLVENLSYWLKVYSLDSLLSLDSCLIIDMDDLETYCLQIFKDGHGCVPLFCYLHMDGTILCLNEDNIYFFIDTFNAYHQNLQFTFELENSQSIHFFLDLALIRENNTDIHSLCILY